jgi:sec-independent protein translocase protein TatC
MEFAPKIASTFTLYARMMLGMALVFEMPTLVLFLARIGVVTPRFLIRNIKYSLLIIFIVAAVVTPDASPVTQMLVAGPMIGLYGLSIVIAWIFQRRRPKPEM